MHAKEKKEIKKIVIQRNKTCYKSKQPNCEFPYLIKTKLEIHSVTVSKIHVCKCNNKNP